MNFFCKGGLLKDQILTRERMIGFIAEDIGIENFLESKIFFKYNWIRQRKKKKEKNWFSIFVDFPSSSSSSSSSTLTRKPATYKNCMTKSKIVLDDSKSPPSCPPEFSSSVNVFFFIGRILEFRCGISRKLLSWL